MSEKSSNTDNRANDSILPDYARLTPFLAAYIEEMNWPDLNWLEDVHMGSLAGSPAVFDRNLNGWVFLPAEMEMPDDPQDRDMLARELLVKFQLSDRHPLVALRQVYNKV